MFRPTNALIARRRGVILLVVISLLTLFAIVGISFVLYANSQASSSQLAREAVAPNQPDMDPEMLLAYFLDQLIFDADDTKGVYSALHGHGFARSMYGFNSGGTNTTPYNGTGRIRATCPWSGGKSPPTVGPNNEPISDYHLVNYMYFLDNTGNATDGVHDPERPGWRSYSTGTPGTQNTWLGGFNAPYTYPDLNNMFLAAVKADGTVLMPSFHRHWLFNNGSSFNDTTNANWTNAQGKYLTLRPRPNEMGTGFPFPEDGGGDVKNLIGSPGYFDPVSKKMCNNDSIWMDLGAPVMTAPDGTLFKPLFAPLIMDLDNRLNLNVVGNIRGSSSSHVSNQGWGPWEVNLGLALNDATSPTEWTNLFLGSSSLSIQGRYGPDSQVSSSYASNTPPDPATSFPGTSISPYKFYNAIDFDGDQSPGYSVSAQMSLYGEAGNSNPSHYGFPSYPTTSFGNSSSFELANHPLLFNYFNPAVITAGSNYDTLFSLSNMEAMLRYGDTGSPAMTSDLFRLCPNNFGDASDVSGSTRRRNLVTTLSMDLDRPGIAPWVWDPTDASYTYQLAAGFPFPTGAASISFPTDSSYLPSPQTLGATPPANSDFATDWRALGAALGKVDLNRPLPDYDPAGTFITSTASGSNFYMAQTARQQLAYDIFQRFVSVTGADASKAVGTPEYDARRWLAQLAVNIVDFIDKDDYMTPFYWTTSNGQPDGSSTEVVFGTELPKVVVNEAYVEVQNDPTDPGKMTTATLPFKVNFWAELLNPMSTDANLPEAGNARLQMTPAQGSTSNYPVYQLVIARGPVDGIRQASNTLGKPINAAGNDKTVTEVWNYTGTAGNAMIDTNVIAPLGTAYSGTNGSNTGFYVLGPQLPTYPFPQAGSPSPAPPVATLAITDTAATMTSPRNSMTTEIPNTTALPGAAPTTGNDIMDPAKNPLPRWTLVLQRLACPYLPAQTDATKANYNPYITVDYLDNVPTNDAVTASNTGPHTPWPITPASQRYSVGRKQPYACAYSATVAQSLIQVQTPSAPYTGQPQNTFFYHNADSSFAGMMGATYPTAPGNYPTFNWLAQLDRQLISPMEVLQVSAFKPHELTQQFITPGAAAQPYTHLAPWFIPTSRLYRAFEYLETHSLATGVVPGGRIPGKLNINTLWDGEALYAASDPQSANYFNAPVAPVVKMNIYNSANPYDTTTPTVFGQLVNMRTPLLAAGTGGPSQGDQPFWGLAAPTASAAANTQYTNGIGINNTFLATTAPGNGLFAMSPYVSGGLHPARTFELMNKIFNNFTTRSNVFAVYVTVGFFQVDPSYSTNPNVRPIKLGAEIGKSENRQIRHRIFAIVDRTNITNTRSASAGNGFVPPIFIAGRSAVTGGAMGGSTVNVDATSGSYEGIQWKLVGGSSQIICDVGVNQETVTVGSVAGNSFTAPFTKNHSANFPIVVGPTIAGNPGPPAILGNPGPSSTWSSPARFDPRANPAIVRYFSVIN